MRLSQVARKLNVGTLTVVEFLAERGASIENKPTTKITPEQLKLLTAAFADSVSLKEEAAGVEIGPPPPPNPPEAAPAPPAVHRAEVPKLPGLKAVGKLAPRKPLDSPAPSTTPAPAPAPKATPQPPAITQKPIDKPTSHKKPLPTTSVERNNENLKGLTVLGKIDLPKPSERKKFLQVASSDQVSNHRTRPGRGDKIQRPTTQGARAASHGNRARTQKPTALSEAEVREQLKNTLAKLSPNANRTTSRAKYRKEKRITQAKAQEASQREAAAQAKVLKVTEFISVNDLASLMHREVTDLLAKCMEMGLVASINQRLDAESITLLADEFGQEVQFTTAQEKDTFEEVPDAPEDLEPRAPIVTIMGHVDHGKTSLLDYIRNSSVTATEAGGITQHIGAYDVQMKNGKRIAFLDTPGHEAFTAMRARGTQITDVAIIVIAADDDVMPQTKEAVNHAQLAGVPIIIAINKIDKPGANPEKVKESLAAMNILVEDWGGKYQCQEISAKQGTNIAELLEKVVLEAELLELKANPKKPAVGSVLEAALDQGRGYTATLMVLAGTLRVGNILLAGTHYGKIKAMFDHRGASLKAVGPATPVQVLGLDGAPPAGEAFRVMATDKEARAIAQRRQQILREQTIRTKRHLTLDEIGKRMALGDFQEIKLIVKGDVGGSVEALADALQKLTTEQTPVNIIHRGVGAITDSDVLLASASEAIIIGFQVRPSGSARKLAEREEIDIKLYSVIYDAIDDIKETIAGMKKPKEQEFITGMANVLRIFKISKVGTIAGCRMAEGVIKRFNNIRLIRDGVVIHTGTIKQMKHLKDDINECKAGHECGINIDRFNDVQVGDQIEGFEKRLVEA